MAPAKLQPALLGGVTIGVLSALPVINLGNCCCAWILFGGALSAYLMQQNHPEPIQAGDGAIVGLLAGVTGAFVWVIASVPISLMMAPFQSEMANRMMRDAADMAPELRGIIESMSAAPAIGIGLIFGALMFKKNQPPVVPPPIPPQVF
jgi:ABC-type phosphate transport system permease subunit